MNKRVTASYFAFAFALVCGAAPGWAFDCPNLYAECQELLKTIKNEKVAQMCEEGIKLHKTGEHDASVEKLEAALELLKSNPPSVY